MKFNVNSADLAQGLALVSKIIKPKATLPILANARFVVEDNTLLLTASDGEVTLNTSIPITTDGHGDGCQFCVAATKLLGYVKSLPAQPCSISIDEKTMNLTALNGTATMPLISADEYPLTNTEEVENSITLPSKVIAKAITTTEKSMNDNDLRPIMNGIYFDFDAERHLLTCAATDTHKLITYETALEQDLSIPSFLLHRSVVSIVKDVLDKKTTADSIKIEVGEKRVYLTLDNTSIIFRKIEGTYPPYRMIFPSQENCVKVCVDAKELAKATDRASIYEDISKLLELNITKDTLCLRSKNIDFLCSAEEKLSCVSTDTAHFGLSSQYLSEVLASMKTDTITMCVTDPNNPVLIMPETQEENTEIKAVIVPIRLD